LTFGGRASGPREKDSEMKEPMSKGWGYAKFSQKPFVLSEREG